MGKNTPRDLNRTRSITKEQILKERFKDLQGAELEKAINNELKLGFVFGAEERKRAVDFASDTVIFGTKPIGQRVPQITRPANAESTYKKITPFFNYMKNIKEHLRKNQTSNQLIANAVELNQGINYGMTGVKVNTSRETLNEAVKTFKNVNEFYGYDLETFPTSKGVESIQEIAMRKYIKNDGQIIEDKASRLETVVGLDPKSAQYKEYQKFIDNFDKAGYGKDGEYKVIADRLAKMGHKDTVLDMNAGHGIVTTKSFASDESKNLMNKENMQKGLDRHVKIWEKQNKERLDNGMMIYEDYILKASEIAKNNFTVSFNGKIYDDPVLNQQMAKVWTGLDDATKKHYASKLGVSTGQIPAFNYNSNMNIDMRDVFRLGLEQGGKSSLYTNEQLGNLAGTLLQQETIGKAFFGKAFETAAHTAGNDVNVLAYIAAANTEDGDTLLDRMMERINSRQILETKVDKNTALMITQPEFFNDWTKKGALNFTTDRTTGAVRTFNGYEIGENVKDMGQYGRSKGVKKDVAYQIKNVGKLNMTEDWVKEMSDIHKEYAQGELNYVTLSPIIDKVKSKGNQILEEDVTYLLPSQAALEGLISSHTMPVGTVNTDGSISELSGKAGEMVRDAYQEFEIENGTLKPVDNASKNVAERVVSNGTEKAMNDSAARMIRENNYKKMKHFVEFQDYATKAQKETIEEQKALLSLATAQKVSKGETLKIQTDIAKIFGYTDKTTNNPYVWSNTINNVMNSYNYNASMSNVYRSIIDEIETNHSGASLEKKGMIADLLMSNLIDDVETKHGGTDKALRLYKKDLDYFEFDMPEGYFPNTNKRLANAEVDNVLRVNLKAEKEYSLTNELLRRRYNDDRITGKAVNKNAYGKGELISFMKEINKSEDYKDLFKDLVEEHEKDTEISADALAEKVQLRLKDFRAENPASGFSKTRTYQDVTKEYKHTNELTPEFISKSFERTKKDIPDLVIIDAKNEQALKEQTEKLVNEMFMPKITNKNGDVVKDIDNLVNFAQKTYGYNDELADIFRTNLEVTKGEYIDSMSNFIKGVGEHGGLVSYNSKKDLVQLTMNGVSFNVTDLIPKTKFDDGILSRKLGATEISGHLKFDASDAIHGTSFTSGKVKISTDIADALNHLKYTGFQMDNAIDRGQDSAQSALSILSRTASTIRGKAKEKSGVKGGSSIGKNTYKDMSSIQKMDFTDIYKSIPYKMADIEAYGGWKEKELVSVLKKHEKSLVKGKIDSEVEEAVAKDIQDIIKIVIGEKPGQVSRRDDVVGKFAKMFTTGSKDTDYNKHIGYVGTNDTFALLNFDNNSRPNIHQFQNAKSFSREHITNFISKKENNLKGKNIQAGSKLVTARQAASASREIEGLGKTEIGIVANTASMSEKTFKRIIANERNKYDSKDKRMQRVFDKLSNMNLTEQGKIMDGHVYEMMMSNSEVQTIKTLKNLDKDLTFNNRVMRQRIEKSMPVIEIAENGSVVFTLGKKQLVKRNDPLVALKGFGGAPDVISAKEQYGLFGLGYTAKNSETLVSEKEISKLLNKHKDKILTNGKIDQQKVDELLSSKYDQVFHVNNLFSKGYNKISTEGPEKAMAEGLLASLGETDEEIEKILRTTGLDDFLGYKANTSTLDNLVDDIIMPKVKALNDTDKKALKYKTASELKSAIKKELFSPTEVVNNIEALKDTALIGIDDTIKHKNAGVATRQLIQNMAYKIQQSNPNLSTDAAHEKAIQEVNAAKLFTGAKAGYKNGNIVFEHGDMHEINIDAAKGLHEKYALSGKYALKDGSSIDINKTRSLIIANNDWSGISMSNPEVHSIRKELDSTRSKMKYATDAEKVDLQDTINHLEHKLTGAAKLDKEMKVNHRALLNMNLYDYDDRVLEDVKGTLDKDTYNKVFGHILDDNGKVNKTYEGRAIHESALNQFKNDFAEKKRINEPVKETGYQAMQFNKTGKSQIASKRRELIEQGYESKDLKDVVGIYGDHNKFLENNPDRIFGKNLLLKTSTGEEIAMPAIPHKAFGDSIVPNEAVKSIQALERAEDRLKNGYEGKLAKGDSIDGLKQNVSNAVVDVKNNIDRAMRTIVKDEEHVNVGKSMYAKANMAMVMDGSNMNSALLDKATFAGKSLSEHAKNGNYVSASWAGSDYFKEYLDNYKKYGKNTRQEMENYLETKGTLGITTRTPDIREGSSVFTTMFLDKNLKNQVRVTDAIVERANQDHDGDGRSIAELVHKDSGDTYASWNLKKSQGIETSAEADKYFNDLNAGIAYEGGSINVMAHNNMMGKVNGDEVAESTVTNTEAILKAASKNKRTVVSYANREIDSSERALNEQRFKALEDRTINHFGEENYMKLGTDDRIAKVQEFIDTLGTKEKTHAKSILSKTEQILLSDEMAMTKTGKGAVGHVNIPLYGLRSVAEEYGMSSKQRQLLSSTFSVLEEGNISRKNTLSTAMSLTGEIVGGVKKMVDGNSEGTESLKNIINGSSRESVLKYSKSHLLVPELKGANDDEIVKHMLASIDDLGKVFKDNPSARSKYIAATSGSNLSRYSVEEVQEGAKNVLAHSKTRVNMDGYVPTTKKLISGAGEVAEDIVKSVAGGSGLAKAAIGLAASVMMAGYIGGNPSIAPGTEAQDLDNYESLQDKDLSIQSLPQGTGQGYVININAQSAKGQDHAVQAIQKAMQSSVTTDINISMNVSDKSKRIDSRYIDNLLSGAL